MKKPLCLLDTDGAIADFVGPYLDLVYQVTGKRFEREDIHCWDIGAALGLTKGQLQEISALVKRPGWCYGLPVLPGAQEGVKLLREAAEVHVVTSPWDGVYWAGERMAWLQERFGFSPKDVTQTSRKDLVRGDFLVDDRGEHVLRWAEANMVQGKIAILWDTPHNQGDQIDLPNVHPRARSWAEVVAVIQTNSL